MSHVSVYVTTADEAEARAIGRAAVEARLAACANIIPGMKSFYWWQGALEEGAECVVIFKTRSDLVDALTAKIKALHSYDCPCVVALPIQGGNPDYLAWIDSETAAT